MQQRARIVERIKERILPPNFWAGKVACWEMTHCPEVVREECPAPKHQFYPCWEIEGTYCKLNVYEDTASDTSICETCRVYQRWGEGRPIEIRLKWGQKIYDWVASRG